MKKRAVRIAPLIFTFFSISLSLLWGSSGFYFPGALLKEGGREILNLRIMHLLAGITSGAFLAASGAGLQFALRNILAEPYLLGISSGAGVGISLWIFFSLSPEFLWLSGFLTGFLCGILSILIGGARGKLQAQNVILAGIAVSTFAGAFVLLLVSVFMPEKYTTMIAFLTGNLIPSSLKNLLISFSGGLVCTALLLALSRGLDALSVGEEFSTSLGINTESLLLITLILASLSSSFCVASSGIIGFVGLVVPHLVRLLGFKGARSIILNSAIGGAGFLLLADTVSRSAFPINLPLGVTTSLIGAPFLAYLMLRSQNNA